MKYEEIEVDDVYTHRRRSETVISKLDSHERVITEDETGNVRIWHSSYYKDFKPLKPQLPETGLVVNKQTENCIYRTGKSSGYTHNEISDKWSFGDFPEHWQPATPEHEAQFIELLKQEAIKRGLLDDTKIDICLDLGTKAYNDNDFSVCADVNVLWNKNGCIFSDGKWATPLKDTLQEVTDAVSKIADFSIEKTDSGVIILTPLK